VGRAAGAAIQALIGHVRGFAAMMRKLTGTRDLPQWTAGVQTSDLNGLPNFANGIQRDLAAVTNALSLSYSSGPVKGHVNRIKTIKRQMYGRANFDLLRRPYPRAHLTPLEPARSRNSCQSLQNLAAATTNSPPK
jgi:Transposase